MRVHKRGIVSPWFEAVKDGRKKFEIRRVYKNEFWVGDLLVLIHETTLERIICKVVYVYDGEIGLKEGYNILGIEVTNGKEETTAVDKAKDEPAVVNQRQVALNSSTNVLDSEQRYIRREQARAGREARCG